MDKNKMIQFFRLLKPLRSSFVWVLFACIALSLDCIGDDDEQDNTFKATVSGKVLRADNDEPISDAKVALVQGQQAEISDLTNERGEYSLTIIVSAEEKFTITASKDKFETKSEQIALTSGVSTANIVFSLTGENPVLKVGYPNGSPLSLNNSQFQKTVTVTNEGVIDFVYSDLETPKWLKALNNNQEKQGTIKAGNTVNIAVEAVPLEIEKLGLQDGQSVEGVLSIISDEPASGEKTVSVKYTYSSGNQAPIGDFEVLPVSDAYLMRQQITFEASNLSDDKDLVESLKVAWKFSDDDDFTTPTNNLSIVKSFPTAGTYNVSMKVIDTEGLETTNSKSVIISGNQEPFGGSYVLDVSAASLYVNREIIFSAIDWQDDQQAEISQLKYSWNFDDGTNTGFNVSNVEQSHKFTSPGTYNVVLSVKDLDEGIAVIENSFTIKQVDEPEVVTRVVTADDIGSNYVWLRGEILDLGNASSGVEQHGFVLSTDQNPTLESNFRIVELGALLNPSAFTSRVTGLEATATYFVKAYAINESGNVQYGVQRDFRTTMPTAPYPVNILQVRNITQTTAVFEVEIDNVGIGLSINEVGIIINTSSDSDPTLNNDNYQVKAKLSQTASGVYEINISGLFTNQSYKARMYAITDSGSLLGEIVSFTTN